MNRTFQTPPVVLNLIIINVKDNMAPALLLPILLCRFM